MPIGARPMDHACVSRPSRCRRATAAGMTLLLLAACGGGGGDDAQRESGLVPTPAALGATLYADATAVRPLVAGASWQYAGTAPGNLPYVSTVTHASATPGVLESATNTFDQGAGSVHVAVVNGNVVQPDAVDVDGDGANDLSNAVELRSPLRVNDQIVYFDRRIPGAVQDIDLDGRTETLDFALYSTVVGAEDVALAGLPTQHAVRVDHVSLFRFVLSKDNTTTPTYRITQSVWYAPSLGVVRRRLDAPAANLIDRDISDERLTGWSGLPG